MNDNNKEHDPNEHEEFAEEFDFDETSLEEDPLTPAEEQVQVPETAPARKTSMLPMMIGIILVGFVGWKLYGKFIGSKNQEAVAKSTVMTPPVAVAHPHQPDVMPAPSTTTTTPISGPAQPLLNTAPQTMPMHTNPLPTSSASSVAPATGVGAIPDIEHAAAQMEETSKAAQLTASSQAIADLQRKIVQQDMLYKQQLEQLAKDVTSVSQNSMNANHGMSAVQQQITNLSAAVHELSTQLQTLQEELEKQKARATVKVAKEKHKPREHEHADANPNLSVHAIIPGRAWLRTQDGKTISVSEGDTVGEYGKVLKVDAANGIVVTTSGVTLR